MIQSKLNDKVCWIPGGAIVRNITVKQGWYFFDKDGYLGCSACETERGALLALSIYETEHYKNVGRG